MSAVSPATERNGVDYTEVTEATGDRITIEALSMMATRYAFAASHSEGRDVLEVGCGIGQGLGYLARSARSVVGGDCTPGLVAVAQAHYGDRVPVRVLDAHDLPFDDASLDAVILFEAIYYLASPARFLEECRRVLRDGGVVLISSANPERVDFNPSPHSVRYYGSRALARLLEDHGFAAQLFGAFAARGRSLRGVAVSAIRRVAVALRLIPRTMKGKEFFKRIFLGRLVPTPAEIEPGAARVVSLEPLDASGPCGSHRVIYAIGRRRAVGSSNVSIDGASAVRRRT